jgi:riboflavin kinase/FMN adenylyltransferase
VAVVTIGTFDGVHAGHRALIARARRLADERGERLVAVTFSPRPEAVLAGDRPVLPDICSLPERIDRLRDAGVDVVEVLAFDRALMNTSAADFVAGLRARHGMSALCVGSEFRLGRGGEGNVERLRALDVEVHDVEVVHRPRVRTKISSSTIRRAIAAGIPATLAIEGLSPALDDQIGGMTW